MKHILTIILLALLPAYTMGDNAALYQRLDSVLAHRQQYVEAKEKSLNELKHGAQYVSNPEDKLKLYYHLAQSYQAYIYDSAMVYVNKGLALSRQVNHTPYEQECLILKADLLISRGFYAEAKEILTHMDNTTNDYSRNFTLFLLYNNWAEYCANNEYGALYSKQKLAYLRLAQQAYTKKDAFYYYLMGEYGNYNHLNMQNTISYYQKVLHMTRPNNRLYARAAFALASLYKNLSKDE